ncbi:hypothetical protein AYO45_06955 [Gammaproteobacteria bacterium SCGC AG-212-F23]|nr:hypothetical protein AYO45_06955 [Gammaproteobacteria bacterium SCGC AG-212-F23]
MATLDTLELGRVAEQKACDFLQSQGLKLVTRNFRCDLGEIDLIMREGEDLIFIEVRSRGNQEDYGTALESVSPAKQKKVIRSAVFYLLGENLFNKIHCRFDIVSVSLKDYACEWVRNAFSTNRY